MVKKRNADVIESITLEIMKMENREKDGLKAHIGETIRTLRKERGWTQEDLARRIGMSRKHISYYENEHVLPSEKTLSKLADIFGIKVDEFFLE